MRHLAKVVGCVSLAAVGLARAAGAQTPFEELFSPRTATSVILQVTQPTWNALAAEQPFGGVCVFNIPPTQSRYPWHQFDVTVITEGRTRQEQSYLQSGVKKKSFCGSFDTTKPSLTLTLDKYLPANEALAESHLGTVHLSLENSKQDGDLFRQCAGYQIFRTMGIPAPMCTFAALYRRDSASAPTVFLGLYVLTEPVKKAFFRRRAYLQSVPSGSLYEFEAPDDFTTATLSQLQVEWSATQNADFVFAVNEMQNNPMTALARTLDLPPFIRFWATEIFLKSWDGLLSNRNNAFVFDDPPGNPQAPISRTRFRFIPHGVDQILSAVKPSVSQTSVLAQKAYADDGLRYQLLRTLASMTEPIESANVLAHIDSFVPLVLRLWRGTDVFFGSDRNRTLQMAETVRLATQQAMADLRTVFGHGLVKPLLGIPLRLVGPHHLECVTRVPTATSFDVRHEVCTNHPEQLWTFEPAATTMTNVDFPESLGLYRLRNQGTRCLTLGAPFTDGSGRYKLQIAACNSQANEQRFFMVQREGRSFELHAYTENVCAHFSDSALTSDGRPAIYLGPCDGLSKKLIVAE